MGTMDSTSDAVFEQRMKEAEASKEAGNAALALGNAKSASFHYKKVYLYLAEYLPSDMAASALASASSAPPLLPSVGAQPAGAQKGGKEEEGMTDNDAANGLVGFLQQRRRGEQQRLTRAAEDAVEASLTPEESACRKSTQAAAEAARKSRLFALYGAALNNLTLVNYKLGRYREGVATASCLLNRVPGFELSPKALLRRGFCYVGLQEPLLAEVNANELERIVSLAKERCLAGEAAGSAACAGEVIEGLGGMTVEAVAGMTGELSSLKYAIAELKKATDKKERKMYQKMFAS